MIDMLAKYFDYLSSIRGGHSGLVDTRKRKQTSLTKSEQFQNIMQITDPKKTIKRCLYCDTEYLGSCRYNDALLQDKEPIFSLVFPHPSCYEY